MDPQYKTSIALVLIAFLVAIAFTTGHFLRTQDTEQQTTEQQRRAEIDALETLDTGTTEELSAAFSAVAEAVQPRAVQIMTERPRQAGQGNPFEGTPFEDFFDRRRQQPEQLPPERGLGSGVIVRSDGYIVTNYHVVADANEISVQLSEGETRSASLVGTDPSSDLAVVKVDAQDLPVIPYAEIESVNVGNWVIAVGSPFSPRLGNSVTTGIVSATGRAGFGGLSPSEGRFAPVQNFIQTDAAINPGNSGGALVDLHGRLVGINTAIVSRTGGNVGIGFAIPIDIVKNVVPQLIEKGSVARGFLGVSFQPTSRALTEALDLSSGAAQVVQVTEGGPAAEAGLESGDIIVSVAGNTLETPAQLGTVIGGMKPGQEARITYIRDDERRTTTVTLGERPGEEVQAGRAAEDDEEETEPATVTFEEIGLELTELTSRQIRSLEERSGADLPEGIAGVLVTNVNPQRPAYDESNLRQGLIITQVAGQDVETVQEFQKIYRDAEPGSYLRLQVARPTSNGVAVFQTALQKPNGE